METALLLVLFTLLLTALVLFAFVFQKRLAKAESLALHRQQNLRYELYAKLHPFEESLYQQQPGKETMMYDGRKEILPSDFTGQGTQAWDYVRHQFEKGSGQGSFKIDGNVITVYRNNQEGRYELHLQRYVIDGNQAKSLPPDAAKQKRLIKLQCEVKRTEASHGLRFVFKGEESKEVLDEKDCIVFSSDWQTVSLYFNVPAAEPTHLRIDDLHVLHAPSCVHIRNLVLFEKAER